MILYDPTLLKYPCISLTQNTEYVDEFTVRFNGINIKALDIHKAAIPIKGRILHNIGELITNLISGHIVIQDDIFYEAAKQIKIKVYSRRIIKANIRTIKVEGLSFFIRHNDEDLRVKHIGSKNMYAVLYEWEGLVFYKKRLYEPIGARFVKI